MTERLPARRVSDADRSRAIEVLRNAYSDGRLGMQELTERSERALVAATSTELAAVVADLPESAPLLSPAGHALLFAGGNAAAWLAWLFTRNATPASTDLGAGYYWPVWVTLVWTMLLVAHLLVVRRRSRRALPPG